MKYATTAAAILVATAIWASFPNTAASFPYYQFEVPNVAYAIGEGGTEQPCITCHNQPFGGPGCDDDGDGDPEDGAADPTACIPASAPQLAYTRPCLNCFGFAFRANGFAWNQTLATLDSDNDGFLNGYELQDIATTTSADMDDWWNPSLPRPGNPDYVTRPGFPASSPGATDADGDGYCWAGLDMNDDGDCLDGGENVSQWDCDDDSTAANSGAAEVCTDPADNNCRNGPPVDDPECSNFFDHDDDLFCAPGLDMNGDGDCLDGGENIAQIDCEPENPNAFPGAIENCIDGVDNDCDDGQPSGGVDDEDEDCTCESGDGDDDGYCALGQDLNDDEDCIDPGECEVVASDCNNADAAINPAAIEDCTDGSDNDCDGALDFQDTECANLFDSDEDGYCTGGQDLNADGDCADAGEDEATVGTSDCLEDDPLAYPGAMETCTNAVDNDCDGDVSLADPDCVGFLDTDDDRYCEVGFDFNDDGDCADDNERQGGTDCNDADPAINFTATELCTDGVDNDCDDSTDAFDDACSSDYLDHDYDGWCEVGPDLDEDGTCDDAGEQIGPADVAPLDPTINPSADENCLDMKDNDQDGTVDASDDDCTFAMDADGDGYCAIGVDLNEDGDCMDDGENAAVSDCNESDDTIHPGADESAACSDWVDNDCDGDWDLLDSDCFYLLDLDGDGYCEMGIDDNDDGDCLDAAEDRFGYDCAPRDPTIGPTRQENCLDGIDNDCDGAIDWADSNCVCLAVEDCDDGDPCTTEMCVDRDCVYEPDPLCGGDAGVDGGQGAGGGGCSCTAPGTGSTSMTWFPYMMVCAVMLLWRRRRRR